MNALLITLTVVLGIGVSIFVPTFGAPAVLINFALASLVGVAIYRIGVDKEFLLRIFAAGLMLRMLVGALTFIFSLHNFFGPDQYTYDRLGYAMLRVWQGDVYDQDLEIWFAQGASGFWGMIYVVAGMYSIVGRNILAVQFFNAVAGAATAPIIYMCAHQLFQNTRVARFTGLIVAFYPSLILWSSQGLKDSLIVFLLAIAIFATMKLGEKLNAKYAVLLGLALLGVLSLRFYIFYMLVAAIGGYFFIGLRQLTLQRLMMHLVLIVIVGLTATYFGVLRTASIHLGTFANLEAVQRSRADLSLRAESGFGRDVDVSTTSGALQAIPLGLMYLLFAPFPWQMQNLRQSITLPEMLIWWTSFPLLILGLWFTIKYRLRQALPILIFISMLTLAYSIYQGNVGTAYRQRAQLLVFYFIFVGVGLVLLKEKAEEKRRVLGDARRARLAYRSSQKI